MRVGSRKLVALSIFAILPGLFQSVIPTAASAAITTAACRDTFGSSGNVTVSVTGNDCVLKFNGSSTWNIPSGVTSVRILIVGGGAAGFWDGGGGGGGGGGVARTGVTVTASTTANIVVGSGGEATTPGAGGESKLDTANDGIFEWVAKGGSIGGGWTTRVGGAGGSPDSQGGATLYSGGKGGNGPAGSNSGLAAEQDGSSGFTSDITGTSYTYGGGGGGGMSSHATGSPSGNIGYSNGGSGGGGAGAAQRSRNTSVTWSYTGVDGGSQTLNAPCEGNTGYPGTTTGFDGKSGFGGGGGGGSAYGDGCSSATWTDGERNRGGNGGSGVVIIRYTPDVSAPVITGPNSATGATSSISIAENTTSVFTFSASETVTWSKSGTDSTFFTLAGSVLTISSRNFELPQSGASSNIYTVIITATDASTNVSSQTLTVTVLNVNEAPVIGASAGSETATISFPENSTSLYNINATDVDAGTSLTYLLTGIDAGDFSINGIGVLSFSPSPDFEAPADDNQDNKYTVTTWVSDGSLSDSQTVTITVTNSNESGSLGMPTLSATPYKGISLNLSVSINAAGKVRFLVGNKRIPNCLAVSATGSGSTFTATCAWKPANTGIQNLSASFTPSSGTFSSATSPTLSVRVFKRTTTR